jgi:hypothetical protein
MATMKDLIVYDARYDIANWPKKYLSDFIFHYPLTSLNVFMQKTLDNYLIT